MTVKETTLGVTSSTTVEEVVEFCEYSLANPVMVDEILIWNLSNFTVDRDALRSTYESDEFIIPFPVTGVWSIMWELLPDDVKECEVLVYNTDGDEPEYRAFQSFYDEITELERLQDRVEAAVPREQIPYERGVVYP